MKKYIITALLFMCAISLSACSEHRLMPFPGADDIIRIEIGENLFGQSKTITDSEEISKFIAECDKSTGSLYAESINDQPTIVVNYFTVKLFYKSAEKNPTVLYLYNKGCKTYIEQAYQGIWHLNYEFFTNIADSLAD